MPLLAATTIRILSAAAGLALVVIVALSAAWWGNRGWKNVEPSNAVEDGRGVLLLVSGDTQGWIVPCGCAANQSGGLPRRGSLVADRKKDRSVILADAGGAPGGVSPYERTKFEAILRGELRMGIMAHNLGGPEARLGSDYLRQISAELNVPFVSANLRDVNGELLAASHRLVDVGGHSVLLVGVLSPQYATGGLRIDSPREAILQILSTVPDYNSLVVLAYLPDAELRELAANLPEADVVVGGPTGQSIAPAKSGPLVLASATNKGKFMVEVPLHGPEAVLEQAGRVIELGPSLADDPAQQENLRAFYVDLERHDFSPHETDFLSAISGELPPDYQIAGSESCRKCHSRDCQAWDESQHARAWQTLIARDAQFDSYCQQCHTTGYHLPGGFSGVRRTPDRVQVGCESCHGPSRAHVLDPAARTSFSARDQCVTCHDRENSPSFEYAPYWAKIVHGTERVGDDETTAEQVSTN